MLSRQQMKLKVHRVWCGVLCAQQQQQQYDISAAALFVFAIGAANASDGSI